MAPMKLERAEFTAAATDRSPNIFVFGGTINPDYAQVVENEQSLPSIDTRNIKGQTRDELIESVKTCRTNDRYSVSQGKQTRL